jgi:hypothetical protein
MVERRAGQDALRGPEYRGVRMLSVAKRLSLIAWAALLPVAPTPALALGSGFIDQGFALTGHSCTFNIYHDGAGQESQVQLFVPGSSGASPSSGGNYWVGGTIAAWPSNITSAQVGTTCGITGITNFVSNGANGTYATDAFMGVTFRGVSGVDGLTYDYTIGLSGASTTTVVNSRVQVLNTAPTANAGPDQTVASGAGVTLNGTASSDPDAGQTLTYAWTQTAGPAVTLSSATAASPGFTAAVLPPGPASVLTFSLVVNDGTVASSADTVTITVTAPANTPPTANAGPDQSVVAASAVTLTGAASNANDAGQTLTYAWTQTAGSTVTLSGAATAAPGFTAPAMVPGASDLVLTFSLVVNDGIAASAADTVTVTVTAPANVTPTANAGPDQSVAAGAAVTLSGAASNANNAGQTLTYVWTQTAGTAVTLTGASTAVPTFTAPALAIGAADVTLTFSLVVNDGIAASPSDSVSITVTAPVNTAPTADAGPDQTVAQGSSVTLDGTGSSDPDAGQVLTYAWTQTAGPAQTLSNATSSNPQFIAPSLVFGDAPVVVTFTLVVDDGFASSPGSSVTVTIAPPANTPPVANAGTDQTVNSGAAVTLDGSASSDTNAGQTLTYDWQQVSGPAVTLTGGTTVSPTFTAPTLAIGAPSAVLVFSLTMDDGTDTSAPDTVQITVLPPANTAPVANAGADQTVASAAAVTLNGAASSDPDAGQVLGYVWTQTSGPAVVLSGSTTAAPSFAAPVVAIGAAPSVVVLQLTVSDGIDSASDSVTVTVNAPPNTAPTAAAGPDQTIASGAGVTLDGSASSANDAGQTLTYAWTQTAGPAVTLSNATAAGPTFTAPVIAPGPTPATLTFSLTVSDGVDTSVADTVTITVTPPANTAPTANAGPDQSLPSASAVTLDGSGSAANDAGQSLTYAWTQTGGPTVVLSNAAAASPGFAAPTIATGGANVTLTFSLVVNDGIAASTADTVTITVTAPTTTLPTANAGADQTVASGAAVSLDGTGSSANDAGQILTYAWTQTAGTSVTLTGAATATPGFAAPALVAGDADATLTFSLTVNDSIDGTTTDTVTITVTAPGSGAAPTVTITGLPATYSGSAPLTATLTFSEPVTGLVAGDLAVANATVTSLTGSGAVYTASLTPTAPLADITLAVPADVAADIESLGNLASATVTITGAATVASSEVIEKALVQRARALINSQPKLRRFLTPGGSDSFFSFVTQNRGAFGLSVGQDSPVWASVQGEWSKDGADRQDYYNLTFGGHLWTSETLILGAMVQFDDARTTTATGSFKGQGWLVGTYLVARMAEQPLVFSASALTGRSKNELTTIGLGTDRFDSKRSLFTAGVEGQILTKTGLVLIPSFDLAHTEDRQDSYIDTTSATVPAQTILLTEASFGLGFEAPLQTGGADVVLSGKLSGVYASTRTATENTDTFRGRIDLGAEIAFSEAASLRISTYYDGLGLSDYEAFGADLLLQMKF